MTPNVRNRFLRRFSLLRYYHRWRWRRQANVIQGDHTTTHDGEVLDNTWIKGTLHIHHNDVVVTNSVIDGSVRI